MHKSVASQAKSTISIESPYSPIYGHFRVCVFLTCETRILLRAWGFFGLKLTLRLAEKLQFSARRLSCPFGHLTMSFAAAFCFTISPSVAAGTPLCAGIQ